MKKLLIVLFSTFFIIDANAQFELIEPNPYRRTEFEDRDFDYNDQSFIDRFTYHFNPEWNRRWERNPEGFRITAGSVSNDEMYVLSQLKKTWFFNDWLFGSIRFRRDEDYDQRFDQTLVGAGILLHEQWTISIHSDVEAKKEEMDLQFELSWEENGFNPRSENKNRGSHARLALILVDHFYNNKSDSDYYKKKPITLFAEAVYSFSDFQRLHLWSNYNLKSRLEINDDGVVFQNEQYEMGAILDVLLGEKWEFITTGTYHNSKRNTEVTTNFDNLQDFSRDNLIADFEFRYIASSTLKIWLGMRHFFFEEDNENLRKTKEELHSTRRKENMIHCGIIWNFLEKWIFRPGIYLNSIDNYENFSLESTKNSIEDRVTGRITLPLEYSFPKHSAKLVVNPTLEWPGHPFGGLNIQVGFDF